MQVKDVRGFFFVLNSDSERHGRLGRAILFAFFQPGVTGDSRRCKENLSLSP
jgi:hypothetical protein